MEAPKMKNYSANAGGDKDALSSNCFSGVSGRFGLS